MGRISVVTLLCLTVLLPLAACDDEGGTLQLSSGPITEHDFRTQVRQVAFVNPGTFDIACTFFSPQANPLPTPEFLNSFQKANLFASRTPIATAEPDDESRAVEIVEEECEDLT